MAGTGVRCGQSTRAFMSRGDSPNLVVVSLVARTTMHLAGTRIVMSRILTGAAGFFLAAWGGAAVFDYIVPESFWPVFLVLAVILLGFFGKAVYDGRVR